MRYLDVCAGISASSVAWKPLGWEAVAYSEIEPAPRAVLEHRQGAVPVDWDHRHSPGSNITPLFGDFTRIEAHHVGPIDLLVGGTPCQDFSVAGLRAGLDGDRGNLSLEFLRLADRTRPRWLVWENVPGVLSIDGGRAFGAILGGLGELGYGAAYRVLDAQHFGVPQRRRRVFVVGHLGDYRRAAAVLFERHGLSGHPAPRRQAGPVVAALTSAGVGTCGADDNQGQAGHLIAAGVADTLPAGGNSTGGNRYPGTSAETAATYLIASTGDTSHCLNAGGAHPPSVAWAIQERAVSENPAAGPQGKGYQPDCAYTLEARRHVQAVAHSLRGEGFDASKDGTGRGTPLVPVCFSAKDHGADAMHDLSPTLRAGGHSGSHANAGVMPAVAAASAVRRLTPRECERLQGFPDDYTLVPHRGKPMADGPRYKALGNSMAVPVMRWIGERIDAVEAITAPPPTARAGGCSVAGVA